MHYALALLAPWIVFRGAVAGDSPARPPFSFSAVAALEAHVEPSGCQFGPQGGLDRIAWELSRARRNNRKHLAFALGNLFANAIPEESDATPEAFARGLATIDWTVVAPGSLDLALDETFWKVQRKEFGDRLVATNVAPTKGDSPFAASWKTENDGTTLVVASVVQALPKELAPRWLWTEPAAAVKKVLGEIDPRKPRVLLVHVEGTRAEAERLALELPSPVIVVRSSFVAGTDAPAWTHVGPDRLLVQMRNRGNELLEVSIPALTDGESWFSALNASWAAAARQDSEAKIKKLKRTKGKAAVADRKSEELFLTRTKAVPLKAEAKSLEMTLTITALSRLVSEEEQQPFREKIEKALTKK